MNHTPEKKTVPFNYGPTPKKHTRTQKFITSELNLDFPKKATLENMKREFSLKMW